MNTLKFESPAPVRIVVTARVVKVSPLRREGEPRPMARLRERFAAEFVGGRFHGEKVCGCDTADAAVGLLVRTVVRETCETHDQVLDLVADLFGFDPARTRDEHLARALRFATKAPARIHPGVKVVLPDTHFPAPVPAPAESAKEKFVGALVVAAIAADPANYGPKVLVGSAAARGKDGVA